MRFLSSPTDRWRACRVTLVVLAVLTGCTTTTLDGTFVPTGQRVTPLAAPGAEFAMLDPGLAEFPDFRAGQAVALAASPDGRTLVALTSGFNRNSDANGRRVAAASNEYIFVYDVGAAVPQLQQVLTVPDSFIGIAWDRDGSGFHVGGGVDDNVHSFVRRDGRFAEVTPAIPLGHQEGLGVKTKPATAGMAVAPDGHRLLVDRRRASVDRRAHSDAGPAQPSRAQSRGEPALRRQ